MPPRRASLRAKGAGAAALAAPAAAVAAAPPPAAVAAPVAPVVPAAVVAAPPPLPPADGDGDGGDDHDGDDDDDEDDLPSNDDLIPSLDGFLSSDSDDDYDTLAALNNARDNLLHHAGLGGENYDVLLHDRISFEQQVLADIEREKDPATAAAYYQSQAVAIAAAGAGAPEIALNEEKLERMRCILHILSKEKSKPLVAYKWARAHVVKYMDVGGHRTKAAVDLLNRIIDGNLKLIGDHVAKKMKRSKSISYEKQTATQAEFDYYKARLDLSLRNTLSKRVHVQETRRFELINAAQSAKTSLELAESRLQQHRNSRKHLRAMKPVDSDALFKAQVSVKQAKADVAAAKVTLKDAKDAIILAANPVAGIGADTKIRSRANKAGLHIQWPNPPDGNDSEDSSDQGDSGSEPEDEHNPGTPRGGAAVVVDSSSSSSSSSAKTKEPKLPWSINKSSNMPRLKGAQHTTFVDWQSKFLKAASAFGFGCTLSTPYSRLVEDTKDYNPLSSDKQIHAKLKNELNAVRALIDISLDSLCQGITNAFNIHIKAEHLSNHERKIAQYDVYRYWQFIQKKFEPKTEMSLSNIDSYLDSLPKIKPHDTSNDLWTPIAHYATLKAKADPTRVVATDHFPGIPDYKACNIALNRIHGVKGLTELYNDLCLHDLTYEAITTALDNFQQHRHHHRIKSGEVKPFGRTEGQTHDSHNSANSVQTGKRRFTGKKKGGDDKRTKVNAICTYPGCGRAGHVANDCFRNPASKKFKPGLVNKNNNNNRPNNNNNSSAAANNSNFTRGNSNTRSGPFIAYTKLVSIDDSGQQVYGFRPMGEVENLNQVWLADSAASVHTTGDKDQFIGGTLIKGNPMLVTYANGSTGKVNMFGDVMINEHLRLTGVAFIAGSKVNLVSLGRLMTAGLEMYGNHKGINIYYTRVEGEHKVKHSLVQFKMSSHLFEAVLGEVPASFDSTHRPIIDDEEFIPQPPGGSASSSRRAPDLTATLRPTPIS